MTLSKTHCYGQRVSIFNAFSWNYCCWCHNKRGEQEIESTDVISKAMTIEVTYVLCLVLPYPARDCGTSHREGHGFTKERDKWHLAGRHMDSSVSARLVVLIFVLTADCEGICSRFQFLSLSKGSFHAVISWCLKKMSGYIKRAATVRASRKVNKL